MSEYNHHELVEPNLSPEETAKRVELKKIIQAVHDSKKVAGEDAAFLNQIAGFYWRLLDKYSREACQRAVLFQDLGGGSIDRQMVDEGMTLDLPEGEIEKFIREELK